MCRIWTFLTLETPTCCLSAVCWPIVISKILIIAALRVCRGFKESNRRNIASHSMLLQQWVMLTACYIARWIQKCPKSLQQSLNFLSLYLCPCPSLPLLLTLILLSQQLPPAVLITTITKYPVQNISSLILSVQRHCFLSLRLGYQTRERLQGALLIHWHSLVSPTLDLSELKGGASQSTKKLCGKDCYLLSKCPPFVLLFSCKKIFKSCYYSAEGGLSWIMALKHDCWSVCTTAIFKVRAIKRKRS